MPIKDMWNTVRNLLGAPLLCSQCFSDSGLRIESLRIGKIDSRCCPNCKSNAGAKLYRKHVETLFFDYFWEGTYFRGEFGGTYRLVSNPSHCGEHEIKFPPWLERDAHLLEEKLGYGLFHNAPPSWQVGEVGPLDDLLKRKTRGPAIGKILAYFPERQLGQTTNFFRLRKNLKPDQEAVSEQYDSPPRNRPSYGRLDSGSLPVLYGSENFEICIHECRVLIPDECFVATLRPRCDLRMLDLTAEPDDTMQTPFESPNVAMRFLFAAESHSYGVTRAIARAARKAGFDGLYYPSYFSLVKSERVANIALFGYPIRDKKIEITSINRALLKSASYQARMGPLFT